MEKIELINNLEKRILSINQSYCLYLCGGYGEGNFDELSDIDLIVHTDESPDRKDRKSILELGKVISSTRDTDMILFEEEKVDLTYIASEKLQRIIQEKKLDYLSCVINTKPLSKRHPQVESEKNNFDPKPFIYTINEMHKKLDVLEQDKHKLEVAFARNDVFYISYMFNYFVERMLKIIYSLNNKPYTYPKKSLSTIKKYALPKDLFENLVYISENKNYGSSLRYKIDKITNSIYLLRRHINDKTR